jgi:hypothetical protein
MGGDLRRLSCNPFRDDNGHSFFDTVMFPLIDKNRLKPGRRVLANNLSRQNAIGDVFLKIQQIAKTRIGKFKFLKLNIFFKGAV